MKVISKIILITALLISYSSCVQTYKLDKDFDAKQAKKLIQKGPNTIQGSALMRQKQGSVVHCGGNEIELVPVTEYASERIKHIYGSTEEGVKSISPQATEFKPDNPAYHELVRTTTCDSQGKFKFENVANGEFFVTTRIIWGVYASQGGYLMKRVEVSGGETKDVVLSP